MSDHPFWDMPNPLERFQGDVFASVKTSLESLPSPYGDLMRQVFAQRADMIHDMVKAKLLKEHRDVLEAIAADLKKEGRDVGAPPWGRTNPAFGLIPRRRNPSLVIHGVEFVGDDGVDVVGGDYGDGGPDTLAGLLDSAMDGEIDAEFDDEDDEDSTTEDSEDFEEDAYATGP